MLFRSVGLLPGKSLNSLVPTNPLTPYHRYTVPVETANDAYTCIAALGQSDKRSQPRWRETALTHSSATINVDSHTICNSQALAAPIAVLFGPEFLLGTVTATVKGDPTFRFLNYVRDAEWVPPPFRAKTRTFTLLSKSWNLQPATRAVNGRELLHPGENLWQCSEIWHFVSVRLEASSLAQRSSRPATTSRTFPSDGRQAAKRV